MDEQNLTKKERKEMRRLEKQSAQASSARRAVLGRIAIWGAVVLVIAGIVAVVWNMGGSGTVGGTFNSKVGEVAADDHVTGNALSTVTLIEYSDFQCPACRAAQPFVKDILRDYGNQIRFVYRHFPLAQHKNADVAAYAAVAAGNQGKFFEMHDTLFDNQDEWALKPDPTDIFVRYASALNLNSDQFKKDLESDATKDRVNRDLTNGISIGINSTPTFFVNNMQLDLPNFAALRTAIEKELKK